MFVFKVDIKGRQKDISFCTEKQQQQKKLEGMNHAAVWKILR